MERSRAKLLFGLGAVVLVAAVVGVGWWWYDYWSVDARTHTVARGKLLAGVTVSGTIRYTQRAELAAEVTAVVKALGIEEGQRVRRGAKLVVLDDSVIAAECVKAEARVELARHHLAELVAGPRKEEITKARESVNRAKSDLDYAMAEGQRLLTARQRGGATESEVNSAANQANRAKHELAWAKAHLALLEAGSRPEEIARAGAELDFAKANLQGCLSLRAKYVLLATNDGVVTVKYVNVGEIVSPGQVLLHVENSDAIEVRAEVQEGQLQAVAKGARASVRADAYPRTDIPAVVEEILPRVDPKSGTVTALLKLTGELPGALMGGMAADITIIEQEKADVLLVPVAAVENRGGQPIVYLRQGGTFVARPIETGIRGERYVEVTSGLEVGDVIRLP